MKNTQNYFVFLFVAGILFSQLVSAADITEAEASSVKPAITGADAPKDKPSIEPDPSLPPLKIEKTGVVERLPSSYPESWVIVGEAAFFNMSAGKMIILDLAETRKSKQIKGIIDVSFLGNFGQSQKRGELYMLESFHKRGTRGPKEDVLAVYDKSTLLIKKEIECQINWRSLIMDDGFATRDPIWHLTYGFESATTRYISYAVFFFKKKKKI